MESSSMVAAGTRLNLGAAEHLLVDPSGHYGAILRAGTGTTTAASPDDANAPILPERDTRGETTNPKRVRAEIQVIELESGKRLPSIPLATGEGSGVLSIGSGPRLAFGTSAGNLRRWELDGDQKWKELQQIAPAHSGSVTSVDQALDGRIVTSGADGSVSIWDGQNRVRDPALRTLATAGESKIIVYSLVKTDDRLARGYSVADQPHAEDYLLALGATVPDLKEGVEAAQKGDITNAERLLEDARRVPGIAFGHGELRKEMLRLFQRQVQDALERKAKALVELGKIEDVDAEIDRSRRQLAEKDLSIDESRIAVLRATTLKNRGLALLQDEKYKEAAEALSKAIQLDPNVPIEMTTWNSLCWRGSLAGVAKDVLFAGDRAVELAQGLAQVHDTRGLARALVGDRKNAIDDFQIFVDEYPDSDARRRRQNWINMLKADKDPFTPKEIAALKRE